LRDEGDSPVEAEALAVTHVAHTLHRALWLMMLPGAGGGAGSVMDAQLPRELEGEARPLLDGMGDEAVAALQARGPRAERDRGGAWWGFAWGWGTPQGRAVRRTGARTTRLAQSAASFLRASGDPQLPPNPPLRAL
jgi:hypothetical protein